MDNANLGRLREALTSFRKAESLLLDLLRADRDLSLRRQLTGVRLDMGVTLDALGRRDEAVKAYRAGIEDARDIHRSAPTRQSLGILSSTLNRLGDTLLASGDPDGAALLYDEVRGLVPQGGTTLARQALAARERGDLERALALFEEAVDLVDKGRNTSDPSFHARLRAELTLDRARTLWSPDRPSLLRPGEPSSLVPAALESFERDAKADSRDAKSRHELLDALLTAGELLASTSPHESLAAFARARACLEALESDMPDVKRAADRGRLASGSALALRGLGRREEAATFLQEALAAYGAASVEGPDDLTASDGLWTATVRLGDLHLEAGRLEDAVRTQREALEHARKSAAALPARPMGRFFVADSCERLARALKGTGRPDDFAEAGRLVNEAEETWRAFRERGLTPAYADARLSGLEALRGELNPRKSQAPPPPGLTSAPARAERR
jgi:tetratricopeptide (TPR) repeat protein